MKRTVKTWHGSKRVVLNRRAVRAGKVALQRNGVKEINLLQLEWVGKGVLA